VRSAWAREPTRLVIQSVVAIARGLRQADRRRARRRHADVALLRQLGFDYVQGYFLGSHGRSTPFSPSSAARRTARTAPSDPRPPTQRRMMNSGDLQ
jgi:EAL domain-containing protein (putative c-di-GMP-specific phosphodiesterase class I)